MCHQFVGYMLSRYGWMKQLNTPRTYQVYEGTIDHVPAMAVLTFERAYFYVLQGDEWSMLISSEYGRRYIHCATNGILIRRRLLIGVIGNDFEPRGLNTDGKVHAYRRAVFRKIKNLRLQGTLRRGTVTSHRLACRNAR